MKRAAYAFFLLLLPAAAAVPWDMPLTGDYALQLENVFNGYDVLGNVVKWWGSALGSAQLLPVTLTLVSGFAGYLHSKSALGGGIAMLLWSPLIALEPVRFAGTLALVFGAASLLVWLFFGK